jgi:four helix bundle protein
MKIERFKEIKAWQGARHLVNLVYEAVHSSKIFRRDFRLVNINQGAAVSAMCNIGEGFSRSNTYLFPKFSC